MRGIRSKQLFQDIVFETLSEAEFLKLGSRSKKKCKKKTVVFFLISLKLYQLLQESIRSTPEVVFLGKGVLKICGQFTEKYSCRSVILIKLLLCNFINIALWHGCFPVNFLHTFRTLFLKNIYGEQFLGCKQPDQPCEKLLC